ncbi:hypothetical protein PCANC_25560 [Puccinia coronata f. sp. avenae]|nr:hypothetical protein PCANC_25560 [Puccinia coronata f. sp. avenae]
MKSLNVMGNSVKFGAIINAVSKTGNKTKAEELAQELQELQAPDPTLQYNEPPIHSACRIWSHLITHTI